MNKMEYLISVFAVLTLSSFLPRALPFFVLKRYGRHPILLFVGKYLPCAAMILLVIYCLKDTNCASKPYGLPELAGVLLVTGLHLWKRNALLSIFGGTAAYILLLHL